MKRCSKCEVEKSEDCFWRRNNRSSGVNSECKECAARRRTKRYSENKVLFRAKRKEYYAKNREKLCASQVEGQKGNVKYRKYQNSYLIKKKKTGDKKFIARYMLHLAVKTGMIIRESKCTQCLIEGKVEGHHEDYNKPLDVIWLCTQCHRALHQRMKSKTALH
jgi:hypothetical protein